MLFIRRVGGRGKGDGVGRVQRCVPAWGEDGGKERVFPAPLSRVGDLGD